MNINLTDADLRPLVERIVSATIEQVESDRAKLGGKLAYRESEAAALLSIPQHSLRDARLRGEVVASKVGSRLLYERAELLRFLQATKD